MDSCNGRSKARKAASTSPMSETRDPIDLNEIMEAYEIAPMTLLPSPTDLIQSEAILAPLEAPPTGDSKAKTFVDEMATRPMNGNHLG